jgi:hypothetical protein
MATTTATQATWEQIIAPRPKLCAWFGHDPRHGVCRDCGESTDHPDRDDDPNGVHRYVMEQMQRTNRSGT